MRKQFKSMLMVSFVIAGLIACYYSADAIDFKRYKAVCGSQVGGYQGAVPDIANLDKCDSEKCIEYKNEYSALGSKIDEEETSFDTAMKAKNDAKINDLLAEIDKIEKNLEKAPNNDEYKTQYSAKVGELAAYLSSTYPDLSEQFVKMSVDLDHYMELNVILKGEVMKWAVEQKKKEVNDKPANTSLEEDDQEIFKDNEDTVDAPLTEGYLPDGTLVAWGIPGLGFSVPSKSRSSESSSTTVQQKEVKDVTYNTLKTVEDNSQKVTQAEVDTFSAGLNPPCVTK